MMLMSERNTSLPRRLDEYMYILQLFLISIKYG